MSYKKISLVMGLTLVLSACSAMNSEPKYISKVEEKPSPKLDNSTWKLPSQYPFERLNDSEIYVLTLEQQAEFLQGYNKLLESGKRPHVALGEYLSDFIEEFTYTMDTNNAEKTVDTKSGNCLSLAIITKAFADLVDLEMKYYQVDTLPIYQQQQNTLVVTGHVQTKIFEPLVKDKKYLTVVKPSITIDYFSSALNKVSFEVSEKTFISMYYRNLATDALLEGDLQSAYNYSANSMTLDPMFAENINLHALLLNKLGRTQKALELYEYAQKYSNPSVNLLFNYSSLLVKSGQYQLADTIKSDMKLIKDPNPYVWLDNANLLFNDGEYSEALAYYEKAIDLASYLDEAYFGAAKTYYKLGNKHLAKKYLNKAMEAPVSVRGDDVYHAKLRALN